MENEMAKHVVRMGEMINVKVLLENLRGRDCC
jgi:hypothetical protein